MASHLIYSAHQQVPLNFGGHLGDWKSIWPKVPAIYFIGNSTSRGFEVVYIGETEDLERRISEHRQEGEKPRAGKQIIAASSPTNKQDRWELQNRLIAIFRPRLNIQANPNRN